MKVKVELFNGKPLSASVPKHVTCTIKETQPLSKGIAATPKDKIATTENGFTVKVPAHIIAGDSVIIDTEADSYVRRAKA